MSATKRKEDQKGLGSNREVVTRMELFMHSTMLFLISVGIASSAQTKINVVTSSTKSGYLCVTGLVIMSIDRDFRHRQNPCP